MSGRSRGHVAAASLPLCHSRDLEPWGALPGLGRDANPSSLLGKAPSGAPEAELERVCLSSLGHGADSSARVLGRERSQEKAPFWLWGDPIWRVSAQAVLGVTGLAAEGYGTSTLARPSWWHLLPRWHCHLSVSHHSLIPAVPGSARSWNRAPAASCCCPASLLTSNPTCFQKPFNF